jgi:nucleoid-associated protein YgaU
MAEAEARRAERREELQRRAEEIKSKVYVVKSGDSLSKIAKQELGDASRWPEIYEANKDQIKDPNLIHPGQELKLPA